ncbi:MAG TPA: hypothetical protein ACFE0H_10830 [Elainellaceae cyanobacterium]
MHDSCHWLDVWNWVERWAIACFTTHPLNPAMAYSDRTQASV